MSAHEFQGRLRNRTGCWCYGHRRGAGRRRAVAAAPTRDRVSDRVLRRASAEDPRQRRGHEQGRLSALSLRADGRKEALGLRIEQTKGAKFWLKIFNELENRSPHDILIAGATVCADTPKRLRRRQLRSTLFRRASGAANSLPSQPCGSANGNRQSPSSPTRPRCVESSIRQLPSSTRTCNRARSSRTAATSRTTKPLASCYIWPCATSKRTGRYRLSLGGKQSISSPFCSASDSPPPSAEILNRPSTRSF